MKKLSFIVLLMIGTLGVSFAQSDMRASASVRTPEERAEMMTQRMTKMLTLNGEQSDKVKSINLEKAQKIKVLREKHADNRQGFRSEWHTVQQETEAAYKEVLTADQYNQYLKAKEERMKHKSLKHRSKSHKKNDA